MKRLMALLHAVLERFAPSRARGLGGWTSRADEEGYVQILPGRDEHCDVSQCGRLK